MDAGEKRKATRMTPAQRVPNPHGQACTSCSNHLSKTWYFLAPSEEQAVDRIAFQVYSWYCSGPGSKPPDGEPAESSRSMCSKKKTNAGATQWKSGEDPRTAYEILGVADEADDETIRTTFRRLVKIYHPDRNGARGSASRKMSEEKCKLLNKAWEVLRDPDAKAAYDRHQKHEWPRAGLRTPTPKPPGRKQRRATTGGSSVVDGGDDEDDDDLSDGVPSDFADWSDLEEEEGDEDSDDEDEASPAGSGEPSDAEETATPAAGDARGREHTRGAPQTPRQRQRQRPPTPAPAAAGEGLAGGGRPRGGPAGGGQASWRHEPEEGQKVLLEWSITLTPEKPRCARTHALPPPPSRRASRRAVRLRTAPWLAPPRPSVISAVLPPAPRS